MCDFPLDMAFGAMGGAGGAGAGIGVGAGTGGAVTPDTGALQEVEHIRDVFPETWLWADARTR